MKQIELNKLKRIVNDMRLSANAYRRNNEELIARVIEYYLCDLEKMIGECEK